MRLSSNRHESSNLSNSAKQKRKTNYFRFTLFFYIVEILTLSVYSYFIRGRSLSLGSESLRLRHKISTLCVLFLTSGEIPQTMSAYDFIIANSRPSVLGTPPLRATREKRISPTPPSKTLIEFFVWFGFYLLKNNI